MLRLGAAALLCAILLTDVIQYGRAGISRSDGRVTVLSRKEIEKISRIAEKSLEEELRNSRATQDQHVEIPTEFVEQPPPDAEEEQPPTGDPDVEVVPGVIGEIEELKRNISHAGTVECNITAEYLWELCRPVMLRTCKEKYRSECRTTPRKFQSYNRRLNRMFPVFRPPKMMFRPVPLADWIEEQMEKFQKHVNNSSWQISLSISQNGKTRTYDNDDFAKGISNATKDFRRVMNGIRQNYESIFPSDSDDITFTTNEEKPRRKHPWIIDWLFGSHKRRGEHHAEEPASRLGGEEEEEERKSYNPTVRIPKSAPKNRLVKGRTSPRREKRSPRPHYYRHGMRRPHRVGGRNNLHRNRMAMQPFNQRNFHQQMRQNIERMHQNMRQRMSPWFRHRSPWHSDSRGFYPRPPAFMPTPHHRLPGTANNWMPFSIWDESAEEHGDRDRGEDEDSDDDEEEVIERNGFEITCEQMEENPEVCMEIAERTEKCENELETVCPEYMAVRRQVREKLQNAQGLSTRHEVNQVSEEDGEGRHHETRENYEWGTRQRDGRPIVIESISISQRGSGDAFVRAKIFNDMDLKLRVPANTFESDQRSLGKVISRMAMEEYRRRRM